MRARFRKLTTALSETFWILPGFMVLTGIFGAVALLSIDRSTMVPARLVNSAWLYNGGGTGARTLLGAVASSAIGVAGTVFSITIASLSLAAGQMGPRLLRNFIHDRGNQFTLGAFLGTFSYTLMVLRSVRTQSEGAFVPHVSMTADILLAFLCVGTLVFFVGHMAGRINVDTVIELVFCDVQRAIKRLTLDEPAPSPPPRGFWRGAIAVSDPRGGYVQQLDGAGLADWAAQRGAAINLLVRPGAYVFSGAPIALVHGLRDADLPKLRDAIRDATALGAQRVGTSDLEFTTGQLVEVAVRALSPGINDPHTAMSVLDRLGAALCELVPRHLPTGVTLHDERPVLVIPPVDYDGLTDTMFHMIRQNAADSAAVLIRLLDVLNAVLSCERRPERRHSLLRHKALAVADAERNIQNKADLADLLSHAEAPDLGV